MSDSFTKEEQLLITEAKLINAMLLEGLDCLRQSNFGKQGLYYQAFYSISYGMERLLKLIIIEDYRSKNDNKMSNNGYLKKYSHDICEMVSDYALGVMDNEINKRIITFFSNFACKSRYYNLNMLTGGYNEFLNPLEEWRNIEDLILQKYNKSKVKIVLRWYMQRSVIPIQKSSNKHRIKDNIDVFDFEICSDDMKKINELDKGDNTSVTTSTLNTTYNVYL